MLPRRRIVASATSYISVVFWVVVVRMSKAARALVVAVIVLLFAFAMESLPRENFLQWPSMAFVPSRRELPGTFTSAVRALSQPHSGRLSTTAQKPSTVTLIIRDPARHLRKIPWRRRLIATVLVFIRVVFHPCGRIRVGHLGFSVRSGTEPWPL